jgi:leucyl-tRNA synthetase
MVQWLADDTVDYLVQVNGKLRAHLTMPANTDTDSLQAAALAVDKVATLLQGRAPRRIILVPNRLINVVI